MLVNKFTGEILEDEVEELLISNGGLWAAFPIPAYQILVGADKHAAKDVLLCLISHLGKGNKTAWPSYTTICKEAKKGRETVSQALKDLNDFGFVKTYTWNEGRKKKRNKYYIQQACYHHSLMNDLALTHLPILRSCPYCRKRLTHAEFAVRDGVFAHWGCNSGVKAQKVQFLLGGIPAGFAQTINHLPGEGEIHENQMSQSEVA
jgi:Helix-turn-helix domain